MPQNHADQAFTKLNSSLSIGSSITTDIAYDSFNVVSIQSTARPGCIIELDRVANSNGHWVKADLFHVYQEGLIRNLKRNSAKKQQQQLNSATDQESHIFSENYFLVLLEKVEVTVTGSSKKTVARVHMWQVSIKSALFSDSDSKQSFDEASTRSSSSSNAARQKNRLSITSMHVCSQELSMPEGVHVVCAETAAADLAASAMFSINRVPYLFATACSDGVVRFWSCREQATTTATSADDHAEPAYEFYEWKLNSYSPGEGACSQVRIDAMPLDLSCSYNSRFAVAFKKSVDETLPVIRERMFLFLFFFLFFSNF